MVLPEVAGELQCTKSVTFEEGATDDSCNSFFKTDAVAVSTTFFSDGQEGKRRKP